MPNKILIATSTPPDRGSGISTYSREISMEMRRRDISVYYASPAPEDTQWLREWGIYHFATEQTDRQIDKAPQLLNLITKEKIAATINSDNATLQSIAPALPCPIVSVGHLDSHAIGKLASYNTPWIDYVVAISNDMQTTFTHKMGVPLHKCPIIYNGLKDPGETRKCRYRAERKLRVVCAGEYSRRKGGDLVAAAINSDHPVWKRIHLDWYGRIPDNLRHRLNLKKHVSVHGRVPREVLLANLEDADVLLLASRSEGCPMAMLEAMSYGVVPIASNGIGAMRWLITGGYDGYICHLDRWPSQALDCLQQLATLPKLLEKMKVRVRNRFLSEFTIERVVDRLLDLLQMPTVERSRRPERIRILKWHRNSPDIASPTIVERLCFRLGILRYEGWLQL